MTNDPEDVILQVGSAEIKIIPPGVRGKVRYKKGVKHDPTPLYSSGEESKRYRLFAGKKYKAKQRGREFSIGIHDVEYPERCPLLGIKLNYENTITSYDSPTLDRIDSKKGYVPGNVWIISHKANRIKSDATVGEIMKLALNLKKKLNESK